jgi:hypothetical protein
MPDPLRTRPRRAKGSLLPRLTGVALVVVVAGGAAALAYSRNAHHTAPPHLVSKARNPAPRSGSGLSTHVASQQTVGLVAFGPYDDKDQAMNDRDDHPLELVPTGTSVGFAPIPPADLSAGTPQWTVDQMDDGTDVFIYLPSGRCLSARHGGPGLVLAKCAVSLSQRWRPVSQAKAAGSTISGFRNAQTGGCITAPRRPGPAFLSACGPAHTKPQEIAFWWSL